MNLCMTSRVENGTGNTHQPAHTQLKEYSTKWNDFCRRLREVSLLDVTATIAKLWHKIIKKGKHMSKKTVYLIKCAKWEEWKKAKNHYLQIGKHGNLCMYEGKIYNKLNLGYLKAIPELGQLQVISTQ
jgi:GT2 family glycosyltransferase